MKNRGFSLIELVIVLILVSLSLALVAPSFSRVAKRIELKGTAQRISGILRYFRSESIAQGKVYQVLFDLNLREIRIESLESGEENEGGGKPDQSMARRSYLLPEGLLIREIDIPSPGNVSDVPAIEFYPNGGTNGGSILLEARDQKGGYRIKVHFLTGIVQIEEV